MLTLKKKLQMESLTNIGFKLNLTDQIVTYTVCLKGFKSISVYWGSYFFSKHSLPSHLFNTTLITEACLNFKYMLRECVCMSPVMVMLTAHPTFISLFAYICKSASDCLATKVLHLYRKWSSQSCRLRPRIQLPWQPIRQRVMVPAASPNWSPPLAQVT